MVRAQDPLVAAQRPPLVEVAASAPRERGRQRGRRLGPLVEGLRDGYRRLLDASGGAPDLERRLDETRGTVARWWPEAVAELAGIAEGAGVDERDVWLLNARTELLAEARRRGGSGAAARECSVAVALGRGEEGSVGIQTWDWHDHLAPYWHPVRCRGGALDWAGITEAGILAKIGVNSAGVGLHLDILHHDDDRAGGAPVHLVAACILAEAVDVESAIAIARTAPVSASSALTVHDGERGVSIELSPAGIGLVEARQGWLVHTNRIQTPALRAGERDDPAERASTDDAIARERLLRERTAAADDVSTEALLDLLDTAPGAAGALSCTPDPGAALGDRWHTLATVITRPAQRRLEFVSGVPRGAGERRELALRSAPPGG